MNKRRDVNYNKLLDICSKYNYNIEDIYIKEKYWRFDINPNKPTNNEMRDEIRDLEEESNYVCQTCWKKSKQYWDYWWRYTHHCLYHYILLLANKFSRKIRRYFTAKYK